MYRGYNVVTEIGRKAADERETRLDAMKQPLLEKISAHEDGVKARELLDAYPKAEQDDAFNVMHRLINDNAVMFIGNGIIKKALEGHNNFWY